MLSRAAAAGGDPARAATLAGVARRIWRDVGRTGFGSGYYRERITDDDRLVRAALGGRDYEAAYRRGWALTPDAAVAYALGAEPGGEPGAGPGRPGTGCPLPAQPPRTRGRRTHRGRADEPRDRGPAVHLAADRRQPHREHPAQARVHVARAGGGVGHPAAVSRQRRG